MMNFDPRDDNPRDRGRLGSSPAFQFQAVTRALQNEGVDINGSESLPELTLMQASIDEFRRAVEGLAGRGSSALSTLADDRAQLVTPPRAADETPRQYAERVTRIAARFRALSQEPRQDRSR